MCFKTHYRYLQPTPTFKIIKNKCLEYLDYITSSSVGRYLSISLVRPCIGQVLHLNKIIQ